jgi:hypothetical protein
MLTDTDEYGIPKYLYDDSLQLFGMTGMFELDINLFTGPTGPTGCTGPTGPTGPINDTPPINPFSHTSISVYNTTEQNISNGVSANFDSIANMFGNCAFSVNTPQLCIWTTGTYYINYSVFSNQSGQYAIFKNSNIIPGSIIGAGTNVYQNMNSLLFDIVDADLIPNTCSPTEMGCTIELTNQISISNINPINATLTLFSIR